MNSLVKREPLNNNGNVPVGDDTDSKTTTVNGIGLWVSHLLQIRCTTLHIIHYFSYCIAFFTEELETQFQEQVSSAIRSN